MATRKKPQGQRKINRKSPRKSASASRTTGGWQETSASGFGQRWEPTKKGTTLEGIITSLRTDLKPLKKGGEKGAVMEIATSNGHSFSVFRSTALRTFFAEADVGDHVRLIYEGAVKMKSGQNPFKQIRSFIKR